MTTHPHILVVEDNLDNSKLVSWILEDEGYAATCVASAEQCLAILEREPFDLILMDISLPGINGKEATRLIRSGRNFHHLPIIALTAHVVENEQQSILESGVNSILTKPLNEELLLAALSEYLPR